MKSREQENTNITVEQDKFSVRLTTTQTAVDEEIFPSIENAISRKRGEALMYGILGSTVATGAVSIFFGSLVLIDRAGGDLTSSDTSLGATFTGFSVLLANYASEQIGNMRLKLNQIKKLKRKINSPDVKKEAGTP